MPPKKKDDKKASQGVAIDEDISDAASLPLLNDFIFLNFYAFKYRRNRLNLEKALFQEFYISPEGETAELAKRNRVIQISDLLNQSKAKGYLSEDEINNLAEVDELRLRQALARSTNELLAAITIPLRRLKAENDRTFLESIEKLDDAEREDAKRDYFNKTAKELELTVFLKDFPRNAQDFQELRRSGAQHQPDIETVVHGVFMIEEMFKRDGDLDDEQQQVNKDSTVDLKDQDDEETRQAALLFKKEDRVGAFNDLVYLNKFARNCPPFSQMRLLTAQKIPFYGPDPPLDGPLKTEEDDSQVDKSMEKNAKDKKAAKEEEKPVEVKSPEELAELQTVLDFVKTFREIVSRAEEDINEYRALSHPVYGIKKVPLWPRVFTAEEEEQARLKKEEEEKARQAIEKAEAEQRRLEEEAAKTKAGAKKAPAAKPDPKAKGAEGRPQSQKSDTSKELGRVPSKLTVHATEEFTSNDDRKVVWNFDSFKKIVSEMDSSKTSVGSILAAMVFQIEKNSQKHVAAPDHSDNLQSVFSQKTIQTVTEDCSQHESVLSHHPTKKDQFNLELDNLFKKMAIEHATVETDFQHVFADNKVNPALKDSPYQVMFNEQDPLGHIAGSYTFMNGKTQGDYETNCLKTIQLPGINNRFAMPAKALRQKAERESDTSAILKFCPLESHMTKRLICLKHFEDLLQRENPEREFHFKQRNCTEEMDAETFRQVLCNAIRMNPDINTAYFDKEDALLLAINFKNPPGRLLRRQWTYPIKTMLDLPDFRKFIKDENLTLPAQVIDIPPHKAGVLRTNSKYCFPCDDSVIRVDKYRVGSRRFGSSVVVKDNLVFGLKEGYDEVHDKVHGQEELINMETRRSEHRNAEMWIEFENKTRMHVAMFEGADCSSELIPWSGVKEAKKVDFISSPKARVVVNESVKSLGPGGVERVERINSPKTPSRVKTALERSASPDKKSMFPATSQSVSGSNNDDVPLKKSIHFGDEQHKGSLSYVIQPSEKDTSKAKQAVKFDSGEYNPNVGASITFTFNEGLVVNIKQNGDIEQVNINCQKETKRISAVLQEEQSEEGKEVSRLVTRQAVVIKTLSNDNKVMYFPDGTITTIDQKRGFWKTINIKGIVRQRQLKDNQVEDLHKKLKTVTKIDPETGAVVDIREDGLLRVTYIDRRTLLIFPDTTEILVTKTGPMEEGSAVTTTLIRKENFAPVRIIQDPVKARSNTIIGLGGTDALMGKDNIMERSNGGVISEVLLPDRTILQTYMEMQELPGYNKFSQSLIHLARRDDFSIIKVRQDGEVVIITANERAYLNEIGKQEEFGKSDFDYFFELFGVPNERRSGVYTCNLEQGRMWTQDEEGNYFIIYANGDSTEKLSVSFNLDQMVEGIDNKEPTSPRVCEGEYIEEECQFLPPPKSVAEPRLFLVTARGATEYFNETQLDYMFRTYHKDETIIKSEKKITLENEPAISHRFTKVQTDFAPDKPLTLDKNCIPKLPQCLEMVNQTVTIPNEPTQSTFLWRNIVQYKIPTEQEISAFENALQMKDELRSNQASVSKKLKIEPRVLNEERTKTQNNILLRIARKRGVNVQTLLADEYNQIKVIDRDERRQAIMDQLDEFYSPDRAADETDSA